MPPRGGGVNVSMIMITTYIHGLFGQQVNTADVDKYDK